MRYLNESDKSSTIYRKKIILEEYDIKNFSYVSTRPNVFLSHSSKDIDKLEQVIEFLQDYNVNVYIDKRDPNLPPVTSSKTAEILKNNIRKCDKFIVLISENSKDSRWIPWELGIADYAKTTEKIALLPYAKYYASSTWTTQEYLGLHRRILNLENSDGWVVYDHKEKKYLKLSTWLKN